MHALLNFKNPYKKSAKQENFDYICQTHFVEWKNKGRKLDKKPSLRRLEFMPKHLTKNAVQEFHLRPVIFLVPHLDKYSLVMQAREQNSFIKETTFINFTIMLHPFAVEEGTVSLI